MKQKKNLVVFDIDGTLTDTTQIHHKALIETLYRMGAKEFDHNFAKAKHYTDNWVATDVLERISGVLFDAAAKQKFEDIFFELFVKNTFTEVKGAREAVYAIVNHTDYAICFATGSFRKPALHKLKGIGLAFPGELLVASNHHVSREEIIETAIKNAQKVNGVAQFEHIISIGDGPWDMTVARGMGYDFIGMGEQHRDELLQNGIKKHCNNWNELDLDVLKNMKQMNY